MVQEFRVLKCFSCQSFQVQQMKNTKRWSCKMCGEKQSILKEFGRGSGANCRHHVQKLNMRRGAMLEEQEQIAWEEAEGGEDRPEEDDGKRVEDPQVSRWSKYLDKPQEEAPEEEPEEESSVNVLMDRNQIHGNSIVRKRKRRGGWREGGRSFPRGEEDWWTPGQPNSSSLWEKPPSSPVRNRATLTSTPSTLNAAISTQTGRHTGPPTGRLTGPLTGRHTGSFPGSSSRSRWTQFFSAGCQDEKDEEEELSGRKRGCGQNCSDNEAGHLISDRLKSVVSLCGFEEGPAHKLTRPKCHECISKQAPPTEQQSPFLPAGSLFDTGEDFDDMF